MMQLRPYQHDAISRTWSWFQRNPTGNPAIVVPPGGGKSVIIAGLAAEALKAFPETRLLVVAHRAELIAQNASKVLELWPEAPSFGIYSATLGRRELGHVLTFANVQGIFKKTAELGHIDLLIIDEFHRVPLKNDGMYRTLIKELTTINPKLRCIVLSATPFRLDEGYLIGTPEKGYLANGLSYEISVSKLLDMKLLAEPYMIGNPTAIDREQVAVRGGEFIAADAEKTMLPLASQHTQELLALDPPRPWIIFASGIAHANQLADNLRGSGISVIAITSQTSLQERQEGIERFKAGALDVLIGADLFLEGFDAPIIQSVILLRMTKSLVYYLQMIGRGLRLAPGKSRFVVVDFGGNVEIHGPIDRPAIPQARRGAASRQEAPILRKCPQCFRYHTASLRTCPECGYQYAPHELKLKAPEKRDLLSKPTRYKVTRAAYKKHIKPGSPPSLKVTYYGGISPLCSEWICIEHNGFAKTKARQWYQARGQALPESVDNALPLADALPLPQAITIVREGRYDRITQHHFEEAQEREKNIA